MITTTRPQRYEIEAWLGPALSETTPEQVDALLEAATDLAGRYPDPDDSDERDAGLVAAYERITTPTAVTISVDLAEDMRQAGIEVRPGWLDEYRAAEDDPAVPYSIIEALEAERDVWLASYAARFAAAAERIGRESYDVDVTVVDRRPDQETHTPYDDESEGPGYTLEHRIWQRAHDATPSHL